MSSVSNLQPLPYDKMAEACIDFFRLNPSFFDYLVAPKLLIEKVNLSIKKDQLQRRMHFLNKIFDEIHADKINRDTYQMAKCFDLQIPQVLSEIEIFKIKSAIIIKKCEFFREQSLIVEKIKEISRKIFKYKMAIEELYEIQIYLGQQAEAREKFNGIQI